MSGAVRLIYLNILKEGRQYKTENGLVYYRSYINGEWYTSTLNDQ